MKIGKYEQIVIDYEERKKLTEISGINRTEEESIKIKNLFKELDFRIIQLKNEFKINTK